MWWRNARAFLRRHTKGSARIRGRVVAAATGRPLLLATVALSGGNPYVRRTVRTDSNGGYEFANLPAGRYSFVASRTGYLEQNFDQPNPLARYRLLELAEGEHLDGMDFRLHRGAAITGVITDEAGDPLEGAYVVAMREQFGPNGRFFNPAGRAPMPIQTDDEGRYRVYGLRPGTYMVMATAAMLDDSPLGFGKTYYPGTLNEPEAQTVRVDFGLDGVANFAMIPARRARVSGIVRDSEGRPAAGMRVTLNEPRGSGFGQGDVSMVSDDGSFTFEHVLPGQYLLHVRPERPHSTRPSPANVEWTAVHVNVTGENVSDLMLTTSAGFAHLGSRDSRRLDASARDEGIDDRGARDGPLCSKPRPPPTFVEQPGRCGGAIQDCRRARQSACNRRRRGLVREEGVGERR